MPMKLTDLLNSECIELDLTEKKKPDLLRELIRVMSRCVDFQDPDAILEALIDRERLSSTGIGSGIAIPHCLTGQVREPHIAFGRKPDGAKFDSADNQPVTLFFLLVGPDYDPSIHLQIL
ncbi:MAG: PTS fructose transporter subunit IIC, partial [Candidatus Aegiribacteria sp.]|nr:PTS fructose transporter subunit IIC [Candidatus Aegiribacteria sp.]MBD3295534.1 PTS fructose transporter subunit IIC [Candidatus Fermentibacteria bacterium]